jgi:hypothetical protein
MPLARRQPLVLIRPESGHTGVSLSLKFIRVYPGNTPPGNTLFRGKRDRRPESAITPPPVIAQLTVNTSNYYKTTTRSSGYRYTASRIGYHEL